MVRIRKYANFIERFLHGPGGQRFFNFAYSIGAAIVIWGALFKILHLPGGNTLLCIGMGTEVLMFLLTAFDRPPKEYAWEDVFPALDSSRNDARHSDEDAAAEAEAVVAAARNAGAPHDAPRNAAPRNTAHYEAAHDTEVHYDAPHNGAVRYGAEATVPSSQDQNALSPGNSMAEIAEELARLRDTAHALNEAGQSILASYKTIIENAGGDISDSASGYARQMTDLNRNLSGLNTIYELQLRHVSGQLDTIDRVNRGLKDMRDMYEKSANESARYCEEAEKMARYMQQINAVYEKMITAMTINMQAPLGASRMNPFAEEPSSGDGARKN